MLASSAMQTACGEIGAGPASSSSQPNSVDLGIPEYANAGGHENGWAALNTGPDQTVKYLALVLMHVISAAA